DYQSLEFLDPNRVQFTYDLVFLGQLNQPPYITSVPVVDAIVGRTYSYAATATDADSNPLTFSLTTAPSAMQVDPTTGQVTWSPTTADLGTHNITLRVDDGLGGYATQSYVINVTTPPPNRPPYFTSEPVVDANVNTAYTYEATAVDPDGNSLTFAVAAGPDGLKIDPGTGLVSWTPTSPQLGPQNVSLTVADGQGGTATQSYTILVQPEPGDHPPVIISHPVTTALAGQTYTYPVKAIDPDGDPLTYSLTTAPQGMTIDPAAGLVSWTPTLADVGQQDVTVRVDDGRGGFDTQSYTIDVSTGAAAEIQGNVFNDLNGDGVRDSVQALLASSGPSIRSYIAADGALLGAFNSGGDLNNGYGIAFGPDDNLYVLDYTTARILEYNGTTGQFMNVVVSDSRLHLATNLVIGVDGNLLVTNNNENLPVMRFNRLTGQYMGDFVPLGSGGLVAAGAMTIGPDGDLYVASIRGADEILRFDGTTGAFIDVFIKLPPERSDYMSSYGPIAIAFGPDGDVYLTDQGNNGAPSPGNCVMRFNGKTGAFEGDFVPTGSGGLLDPTGMAWGPDGNLYVGSYYTNQILRYDGKTGAFIDAFVPDGTGWDILFHPTLEPFLAGWTIYLDANGNGRLEPGDISTTTDANGNFSFPNLLPGTYTVAEVPQAGWNQTAPSTGTYQVTVDAGQVVTGIDFGDQQATRPPVNHPPQFVTTAPTSATVGQPFRYDAQATDLDNGPLTYDLVVKPIGMAVDPTTGVVVWTPASDEQDRQSVILRVADGKGSVDLQSFQVLVVQANSAPVITSSPKGPVVVSVPYFYQVTAQDAENNPITFSLAAFPDGKTIDAKTGLVLNQ